MAAKCPVRCARDFSIWYTPGVAAPCREIHADPELVYEHTNKANTVAIVSDGSRVLGLGDIGPEAGLPVMEGKALLFKYLGGVDAQPLCLDAEDPEQIIQIVKALQPSFGGINLEDISQPRCFQILDQLRAELDIPVWHDDQQGTATVLLAALVNALKVVGKDIRNVRLALIGVGAANVASYRLLRSYGVDPAAVIACDSQGILHKGRHDIQPVCDEFPDKWTICRETNTECVTGGVAEAMRGSDVCIAFSVPKAGIIRPDWIRTMAVKPIVFACANPVPEIWPWDAVNAGAKVVATGRGDFPNQVNNSLAFPGVFRGALDIRASNITDDMAIAAAKEIAATTEEGGLHEERIVPEMTDTAVYIRVAVATAMAAQEQGVAKLSHNEEELRDMATQAIETAQETTRILMQHDMIAEPPGE